jgi:hypothetical protein
VHRLGFGVLCFLCCQMPSSSVAATAAKPSTDQNRLLTANQLQGTQRKECSRRVGPFATQDRAWQRWREAKRQGYRVSEGIFPCYDEYRTRGYCFNVFFSC